MTDNIIKIETYKRTSKEYRDNLLLTVKAMMNKYGRGCEITVDDTTDFHTNGFIEMLCSFDHIENNTLKTDTNYSLQLVPYDIEVHNDTNFWECFRDGDDIESAMGFTFNDDNLRFMDGTQLGDPSPYIEPAILAIKELMGMLDFLKIMAYVRFGDLDCGCGRFASFYIGIDNMWVKEAKRKQG